MSNKTINDFSEATTLADADIFLLETDPSGSPVYKKITWANLKTLARPTKYYGAVFDGGGSAIAADKKAYIRIPISGTIVAAYIIADVSGTISIEVWKDTFADFPPTVADKISASAPIALSSAQSGEDTTLTGWTKTVTAGDVLCFNVSALATSITWCAVGVVVQ